MRKGVPALFLLAGIAALSACGTAAPLDEIRVIDRRSLSENTGGDTAGGGVNGGAADTEELPSKPLGRKPTV